ncbi:MAG: putative two-component system response regulator [Pirellulaceae bacterium]|jgi:putative two-component system response regulator
MTITMDRPKVGMSATDNPCLRQTIMIIDDVPVNVKVLKAHLQTAGYESLRTLSDSTEAIAAIYREQPDLVLLDLMMPEVSGLDILEALRSDDKMRHLPIVILTGTESSELRVRALNLGATDFLTKPVDLEELLPRVRNTLTIKLHQDELEQRVAERTLQLEQSRLDLIHRLAKAAEYRDNETGRHVIRVGSYAGIIASELGLPADRVSMIEQAATLHDLGKIGIPDAILHKPGKLSPEEFRTVQKHCSIGHQICESMDADEFRLFARHTLVGSEIMQGCGTPLLDLAGVIALTHHEKWDGSGYPLGLAGEDIPIEGRITAVADVFDALSSKRPYKEAFCVQKCFHILEEGRESHFDPLVLDALFARKDDIVRTQIKYADRE